MVMFGVRNKKIYLYALYIVNVNNVINFLAKLCDTLTKLFPLKI